MPVVLPFLPPQVANAAVWFLTNGVSGCGIILRLGSCLHDPFLFPAFLLTALVHVQFGLLLTITIIVFPLQGSNLNWQQFR